MYLNLNAFNARTKYERLIAFNLSFEGTAVYVKTILNTIMDFNSKRNVIYTCMRCSKCIESIDNEEIDIYGKYIWRFAYELVEDSEEFENLLLDLGIISVHYNYVDVEATKCPFMNEV